MLASEVLLPAVVEYTTGLVSLKQQKWTLIKYDTVTMAGLGCTLIGTNSLVRCATRLCPAMQTLPLWLVSLHRHKGDLMTFDTDIIVCTLSYVALPCSTIHAD